MTNRSNRSFLLIACLSVAALGCGGDESRRPSSDNLPSSESNSAVEPTATLNESKVLHESKAQAAQARPSEKSKANQPGFMSDAFEPLTDPGQIKWDKDTVKDAEIPESVPIYPHSTRVGGTASKRRFVFEWGSTDDKTDIMDFFRTALVDSGYTINSEESYGAFDASKDGQKLSVWIGAPPNKPISIVVRLEYK